MRFAETASQNKYSNKLRKCRLQNVVLQNTVADFDPQQVVDVIQTRLAPEDWVVTTAQRGLLVIQVVRNGLFALGSGVASLFFFSLWFFSITHLEGNPDVIYGMLALFVAFVGSGLFPIVCAVEMWKAMGMLIAAQTPWIAVTPNGVVEYCGPTVGIRYAFAFANVISGVPLRQQPPRARWLNPFYQGVGLSFSRRHPANPNKRLARPWTISPGYPLPEQLAQLVIVSQRAYRSRAVARSPWGSSSFMEPVDPRMLRVANPVGWSWTLTGAGILFILITLAWAAFVIGMNLAYPNVPVPWIPFVFGGFLFVSGLTCWLLAWRINDWKRDV